MNQMCVPPLRLHARSRLDTVIVDQRDESLATSLIVPLIAGMGYPRAACGGERA